MLPPQFDLPIFSKLFEVETAFRNSNRAASVKLARSQEVSEPGHNNDKLLSAYKNHSLCQLFPIRLDLEIEVDSKHFR